MIQSYGFSRSPLTQIPRSLDVPETVEWTLDYLLSIRSSPLFGKLDTQILNSEREPSLVEREYALAVLNPTSILEYCTRHSTTILQNWEDVLVAQYRVLQNDTAALFSMIPTPSISNRFVALARAFRSDLVSIFESISKPTTAECDLVASSKIITSLKLDSLLLLERRHSHPFLPTPIHKWLFTNQFSELAARTRLFQLAPYFDERARTILLMYYNTTIFREIVRPTQYQLAIHILTCPRENLVDSLTRLTTLTLPPDLMQWALLRAPAASILSLISKRTLTAANKNLALTRASLDTLEDVASRFVPLSDTQKQILDVRLGNSLDDTLPIHQVFTQSQDQLLPVELLLLRLAICAIDELELTLSDLTTIPEYVPYLEQALQIALVRGVQPLALCARYAKYMSTQNIESALTLCSSLEVAPIFTRAYGPKTPRMLDIAATRAHPSSLVDILAHTPHTLITREFVYLCVSRSTSSPLEWLEYVPPKYIEEVLYYTLPGLGSDDLVETCVQYSKYLSSRCRRTCVLKWPLHAFHHIPPIFFERGSPLTLKTILLRAPQHSLAHIFAQIKQPSLILRNLALLRAGPYIDDIFDQITNPTIEETLLMKRSVAANRDLALLIAQQSPLWKSIYESEILRRESTPLKDTEKFIEQANPYLMIEDRQTAIQQLLFERVTSR